jgi:iron(III) transport system substrate-binding protein
MRITRRLFLVGTLLTPCATPALAAETVNVYSYRQPELIDPLFKRFTKTTGIEVRKLFAENGLIERIEQEGALSPVDILLTADVGRLVQAADKGLAQPVESTVLSDAIPANLRSAKDEWFGLTMRARVIYASRDRVKDETLSYEDLADPKWKGKICIRPGNHPYNLALFAAMIAHKGEEQTKAWLTGLKANLAVKPSGNDREQAKGVFAGECDIAVANTYYMGVMLTNEKNPEQKDWAKSARIIFPASAEIGTHVNVSGMMLAKNAPNRANAVKLMEFLAGDEAQSLYANQNFEYPVNSKVKPSEIVQSWGAFTPDALNLEEIARNEKAAARLVDEVGFND